MRSVRIVVALAAPVLCLAALWLWITQVLLVPSVPDASAPAGEVAQFIMHPKGLPRLSRKPADMFLNAQIRRIRENEKFRDRFIAEYRTASPEDQARFRSHVFDAIKPRFMGDFERYQELEGDARRNFLDERIVAYNRMSALWQGISIHQDALGSGTLAPQEAIGFLFSKTTEEERDLAVAYGKALAKRIEEILADPELEAQFRERIDAPDAGG